MDRNQALDQLRRTEKILTGIIACQAWNSPEVVEGVSVQLVEACELLKAITAKAEPDVEGDPAFRTAAATVRSLAGTVKLLIHSGCVLTMSRSGTLQTAQAGYTREGTPAPEQESSLTLEA